MMQAVRVQSVDAREVSMAAVETDEYPEAQIDVVRRTGWRNAWGDAPDGIDRVLDHEHCPRERSCSRVRLHK